MVRILEHSTGEDRATEQERRELEREERQEEGEKKEGKRRKEGGGRVKRYLQICRKFSQVFSYVQISTYICNNYQRQREKNTQKN